VSRPIVLLVGITAVLYCRDLGRAPVYLGGDEAHFGVQAYSIARTGRDLNGRVMPLFFNLSDPLAPRATPRAPAGISRRSST